MLGRLEMDVDECIDAYLSLIKSVFEKKKRIFAISWTGNIQSRFSSKVLESAIKKVIGDRKDVSVDDPFHDTAESEPVRKCKV